MKLRRVLPGAYLAVALVVWIDFILAPPDGLANVGVMLVVLPLTLLDLLLRSASDPGSPVLVPDSLGYYLGHTLFLVIGAMLIAACLVWLGGWIDRRLRPKRESDN